MIRNFENRMMKNISKKNVPLTIIIIFIVIFFSSCKKEASPRIFPPPQSCPDIPFVNYQGESYPTVLIGEQCWLSKNLTIGNMVISDMSNNDTIEKHCYNDDPYNCNIYGGLYSWDEAMQYSTSEGSRGICPEGWHIPSEKEFTELLLYCDFYPDYLMNTESGLWFYYQESLSYQNAVGFSAIPAGIKETGEFLLINKKEFFFTSSMVSNSRFYHLALPFWDLGGIYSSDYERKLEASVRCIKDE